MARTAAYDRDVALQAAMTLFWKKGFHATSLKDLEASLNMKPGSIYSAFSSKSNLYLLALERYFLAAKKSFTAMASTSGSPLQALSDKLRDFAALPTDHEQAQACMLLKTLIDTRSTDPEISNRAQTYISEMRKMMVIVFENAKRQGELPKDADSARLARRYQAAIASLRLQYHQGSKQSEINDLAEDLAQEFERLRV